jgi:hypothetical protein
MSTECALRARDLENAVSDFSRLTLPKLDNTLQTSTDLPPLLVFLVALTKLGSYSAKTIAPPRSGLVALFTGTQIIEGAR